MRLLHVTSHEFEDFTDEKTPPYAVLSHTWGECEITFQDFRKACSDVSSWQENEGFRKILQFCEQASGQFEWVWVDTCCIDKTSSAELSEAINSMYRWYRRSDVCFTYLADVEVDAPTATESEHSASGNTSNGIRNSRWFTRGWTLQELLAPKEMHFYDKNWNFIGTRQDFREEVLAATGIPPSFLNGAPLSEASIAQKMSWASKRTTKRPEDVAYCLLGLFDINMPLIYGEGKDKAFRRLQEEIVKTTDDHSLFAWGFSPTSSDNELHEDRDLDAFHGEFGLFARSPGDFQDCGEIIQCDSWEGKDDATLAESKITKSGLFIELPVISSYCATSHPEYICGWERLGVLNCRSAKDPSRLLALPLVEDFETGVRNSFNRYRNVPVKLCYDLLGLAGYAAWHRKIYIRVNPTNSGLARKSLIIRYDPPTGNHRYSFALDAPFSAMISDPTELRGWRREILHVGKSLQVTEGGKSAAPLIPASTWDFEGDFDVWNPVVSQAVFIYYAIDLPGSRKPVEFILRVDFQPSRLFLFAFLFARFIGAPPLLFRSLKGSMACGLANGSPTSDLNGLVWAPCVFSGTRKISLISSMSDTGHNIWAFTLVTTTTRFIDCGLGGPLIEPFNRSRVFIWVYGLSLSFLWLAHRSGDLLSLHLFNATVLYATGAALFGYSLSLMSRRHSIGHSVLWFCVLHLLIAFSLHFWS